MKRPDGYLPRAGDVINLTATVSCQYDDGDEYVFAKLNTEGGSAIAIRLRDVDIRKFNLRSGEWVRLIGDGPKHVGQVLAVHEGWVWTKGINGELGTFVAECLEPCDDPTLSDILQNEQEAESKTLVSISQAMREEPCDVCGTYHPDHTLCPNKPSSADNEGGFL